MRRLLTTGALLVALTAAVAAQQRTADQILDQMGALVDELKTLLAPAPAVVEVATVEALQAALAEGGTIQLAPGTYATNVRIAVPGTTLLAADATITAADKASPALDVQADDFKAIGAEFVGGLPDRAVVRIGLNSATSIDDQPARVTLDSIIVHPAGTTGVRGIEIHGCDVTVQHAAVTGFLYSGRDSQAIWVNNTSCGGLLLDNDLSASGEVVMFGGDHVRIPGAIPTGWVVRGNRMTKPQAWRDVHGSVKNSFELKNAQDVLVEDNVFDGNWRDAQDGSQLLLTPRSQYGDCPWCVVRRVTIRRNVFRNAPNAFAINILGTDNNHPSGQVADIVIEQNYFPEARNGIRVTAGVADRLVVRRNTWPAITGNILSFDRLLADGSKTPLTFTGNVARSGSTVVAYTATAAGLPSLLAATTLVEWGDNIIERTWPATRTLKLPAGTTILPAGGLAPLLDADGHFTGQPADVGF